MKSMFYSTIYMIPPDFQSLENELGYFLFQVTVLVLKG